MRNEDQTQANRNMSAKRMLERLLQQKSLPKIPQAQVQSSPARQQHRTAKDIVEILLDGAHLCEATVHRPRRGSIWVRDLHGSGQALFSLARSPIESQLIEKILLLVQQ